VALFKKAAVPVRSIRAQTSLRVVEGRLPPTNQSAIPLDNASTYLDYGSSIKGTLNFDGPVRIDGEIEGEINSKDIVAIGEGAIVSADIKAVSSAPASASRFIRPPKCCLGASPRPRWS
jgi:Polymer-forming cytoskeletal